MKYRLTTIERDAAGNVYRCPRPYITSSSLAVVVRGAEKYGWALGAESGTGLTIIAVEFTSEDAP